MDLEPLSLSMTVGEVQNRWPQTIPVFLKHHMSCVGCAMSIFDSVEDVVRVYQLPLDNFIDELIEAISGSIKTI